MKIVLQRVTEANVKVNKETKGKINKGLVLLIGIHEEDDEKDVEWLIRKVINMRIFCDANGKMNLSVQDIKGEILCISQFTLLADYKKGNRPSFMQAMYPEKAKQLMDYFIKEIKKYNLKIESGIFGADMKVSLINDGPVTIVLDSKTKN